MRELEDEIARLNLRAEQLLIHLQRFAVGSPEAIETRRNLELIVETMVFLKGEHARVLSALNSAPKQDKGKHPPRGAQGRRFRGA